MSFDLSQYETVDTRIHKFWGEHKGNGRLVTELVHVERDETGRPLQYIGRAEVWVNEVMIASDYAEEVVGGSPVNRTSALENCMTSALGRALATAGYSKEKFRASMTEMTKAERLKGTPDDDPFYEPITPTPQPGRTLSGKTPGKIPHTQKASVPQVNLVRVLISEWAKELSQDPLDLLNAWLGDHQFEPVTRFEDIGWRSAKPLIDELKGKK
jgi:hypothetical protein